MNYSYDFVAFIGRFCPFHCGHQRVVELALEHGQQVVILIGSASQTRTASTPFTFPERESMLRSAFGPDDNARIHCFPLRDFPDDRDWVREVRRGVQGIAAAKHRDLQRGAPRVALIGHHKDASSYYLDLFPHWQSLPVTNQSGISATPIREAYFADSDPGLLDRLTAQQVLPGPVADFLRVFPRNDIVLEAGSARRL